MKKRMIVFTIVLSLLLSGMLVTVQGEATFEGDKTVIEWDGEVEKSEWSYPDTGKTSFMRDISFDEVGTSSLEIMHDGDVLANKTVLVEEREGVPNLSVRDFTVEPAEEDALEYSPAEVVITAEIEHDGEVDEDRSIELTLSGSPLESEGPEDYSWMIEPGGTKSIETNYTFDTDGMYPLALGEAWELIEVGVGQDVKVDYFSFSGFEAQTVCMQAEIINVANEAKSIRMRIEDGEGTNMVKEDWTVEAGERKSIEYSYVFDQEGTYDFILGPARKSITVGGDENFVSSVSSSSDEEGLDSGVNSEISSDFGTPQQDQDIRVTTFYAPDNFTVGEMAFVEVEIENELTEEQEISLKLDDELIRDVMVPPSGKIEGNTLNFTFDMQADSSPKEMVMEYSGSSSRFRQRHITIERPDGEVLEIEDIARDDWVGNFQETVTVVRRDNIRENIYEQAKDWLRKNTDVREFPSVEEVNPTEVIFGKQNEEWLHDPEPLKGEYELNISVEGTDVQIDDGQATLWDEKPFLTPDFEIEITDYDEKVDEGGEAVVEYTVTNTGAGRGTQNITLNINDEEKLVEEDLTLDAGENYTGEFRWNADEVGECNLEVASDDDGETGTINVQEEEEDDGIPGFTVILLLLAMFTALAIYHEKKR